MNAHTSPRRRRRLGSGAALATAGVLVALSVPSTAVAAAGDTTIDLYDVNDFHGRIAQSLNAPPRDGDAAGAATLAGALQELRGEDPSTSAFVSAGDNIGGSTFESFIQDDQPTIDVLNQMDLSVSAIGNHELDKGQDDLRDRVIGGPEATRAQWDYVSANILDSATGKPAFDPYAIEEISGKRVGFIGATVDLVGQGLVSPDGIAGLEMGDITTEVNRVAADLTDGVDSNGEADVLVLLVHDGAESSAVTDLDGDGEFARAVHGVTPKVSAILSAHTHQTYVHAVVPDGGTVARPVIQTGSYGFNLGHVQLTVAADGAVTPTVAENIRLVDGTFTPDPDVQGTVDAAVAKADELGAVPLGTVDRDLRRAVQSDRSENRGGESTLGNFVAEVQRAATTRQGSQIAFMNPGGLRADIDSGSVTYKEAAVVQPFANTLVVLDLTGAQVRQALEQQWQPAGASRPFLKLGASDGFAVTYDPTAAAGSRVASMTLDGAPVTADSTYKVTVNSFLAGGGDNFAAFAQAAAKQDSGKVDLEAQVEYFRANPSVEVQRDQRSVGVHVTPTPAGGFQPGDAVSIDLSSLTFSNETDQAGTVSVSAGDQVLASSPVDTTVVDKTDEQGRATLTFRVPGAEPSTNAGAEPSTNPVAALGRASGTTTLAAAVTPAATTEEPLVVTLPNGQTITLAVTIPVAAVVDPGTEPGTDPGTGGPTTPDDGDPTTPGAGEVGVDIDGDGVVDGTVPVRADGELAFTGAEIAAPAIAAGLLLLAGLVALLVVRRNRAELDGAKEDAATRDRAVLTD
ncbi:bifunctional UDP-sugar hydrolase/5'-nucleotidase [Curtobacterium sp. MCPF17_002]|uniref:bifunctional metallophosphatase/5'-nucleotidase n=1 Tax=Curtobacterium sp. MCPF17_002 TaxID=2175645 RepID=UPI000DA82039|nr:bifunctional UDP-sugar hydrolase/5'-nucleotidase [Curtobacterium sp. MCPF17_002]WIB76773.1 bifunctional UDP-sugar hydrolase/5'-nucleotidase [Curtobacterium sp. MCPF17_002]